MLPACLIFSVVTFAGLNVLQRLLLGRSREEREKRQRKEEKMMQDKSSL